MKLQIHIAFGVFFAVKCLRYDQLSRCLHILVPLGPVRDQLFQLFLLVIMFHMVDLLYAWFYLRQPLKHLHILIQQLILEISSTNVIQGHNRRRRRRFYTIRHVPLL